MWISVLLPVYKESNEYVRNAVDSILNQSFRDFVLYVRLDDPENERLKALMEEYARTDERMVFRVNERNLGLAETLNSMLEDVDTPYVARMDADDIAAENRFEVQLGFMQAHPNIALCGTNMIYIDENGNELRAKGRLPEEPAAINRALRYLDVLCHPTFLARTTIIKQMRYRPLRYSQDYDLVARLAEAGNDLANINEYLLKYRIAQADEKKKFEQRLTAGLIRKHYCRNTLGETDIVAELGRNRSNANATAAARYSCAEKWGTEAVYLLRKKLYLLGAYKLLSAALVSRYYRQDLLKSVIYRCFVMGR